MYKKIILNLFLFLTPIAFIEQIKNGNFNQIISNEYVRLGHINHNLIDRLFEADEENSIEIKNCWEEGDLLSQKRYCSSIENYFQNF